MSDLQELTNELKESQFGITESHRRSGKFDAENRVCTEQADGKIMRKR